MSKRLDANKRNKVFGTSGRNLTFATIFGSLLIGLFATAAKSARNNRIVGGSKAEIEEFPWQAALFENDNFTCGAAIVSERHVITAAHCVYVNSTRILPNIVTIRVGSAEIYRGDATLHDVASIEIHPKFAEVYPYLHDIAVLTLVDALSFGRTKSSIKLPTANIPVHVVAKFSGWGSSLFGRVTKHLEKLEFTIMSNYECDKRKINTNHHSYNESKYQKPLISGQVCGLPGLLRGACEGDSGGALVYDGSLAGILSWKYGCGKGYPNIFTRVYKYIDWIREKMV